MTVHPSSPPQPVSRPDPNQPQRQAAIPDHDIWVTASAGSGKTKVLTDRVLRLLLPDPEGRWEGAEPHRILCITFTKAAAALMALRVQNRLAQWAIMDDSSLRHDLNRNLLGFDPPPAVMNAARQLFSKVLDVPNGLNIMTIHAFCQSVLGRFTIEAGVTPNFTVLAENHAHEILHQIIQSVIMGVQQGEYDDDITARFHRIATYLDMDALKSILLSLFESSYDMDRFFKEASTPSSMLAMILESVDHDATRGLYVLEADIRRIFDAFQKYGKVKEGGYAKDIGQWLAMTPDARLENLTLLLYGLKTKTTNKPVTITKDVIAQYPDLPTIQTGIIEEIEAYLDNQAKLRSAEQTVDLLTLTKVCFDAYRHKKTLLNALDFSDLILKARHLLETENLEWVRYKLDEGIDHILVDEAQDTNIHQWKIIDILTADFMAGLGNDNRLRSLFVVGDEKQSIFSFHGADPKAFHTMRDTFEKRSQAAERIFHTVPLSVSFRSAPPILNLVDAVFNHDDSWRQRIGLPTGQTLVHHSFHEEKAGLVECAPPVILHKKDNKNAPIAWALPPISLESHGADEESSQRFSSPLAVKIATMIAGWLKNHEILASENRAIEPRDILILVRTRTPFVSHLIRELKWRGVPVSGIDRMKLTDHIAVMDCLALARFARFPSDDMSLACLLKSPFIRMDEDSVMALALGRTTSLWERVQERCPAPVVAWLQSMVDRALSAKPFDFFDTPFNSLCPYDDGKFSAWKAFATCLGEDCLDPLDEFLSYCLALEDEGVFSLEECITLIQSSDITIKRDADEAGKDSLNQVRIMTVHASKGLEAPIVILPDTLSLPLKRKIKPVQWIARKQSPQIPVPLWAAKQDDSCLLYKKAKEEAYDESLSEHLRLLYVALTRPKDRLYIMGESTKEAAPENSWYHLILTGFKNMGAEVLPDGTLRYESRPSLASPPADTGAVETVHTPASLLSLPDWALKPALNVDKVRPKMIRPSLLDETQISEKMIAPNSQSTAHRFRRGLVTHSLFQILPDLPAERRRLAAEHFLATSAKDLPQSMHIAIIDEVMHILNDAVFAPIFGSNALAEVPIAGTMGDGSVMSGQIDRLVIDINKILVVDFKTNRPSPRDVNDVPAAYRRQMKAYKDALSLMYPYRPVICALLWTDQPLLMPLDI